MNVDNRETKQEIIPWRTFYFHIMHKKNSIYELEEKIKRGVNS